MGRIDTFAIHQNHPDYPGRFVVLDQHDKAIALTHTIEGAHKAIQQQAPKAYRALTTQPTTLVEVWFGGEVKLELERINL